MENGKNTKWKNVQENEKGGWKVKQERNENRRLKGGLGRHRRIRTR